MAEVEGVVCDIVLAGEGVAAVFGDRIELAPLGQDETLPAMTYQVISRPSDDHVGIAWMRIQLTLFAETQTEIVAGAKAVRRALSKYRGVKDGVTIMQITYLDQHDQPEPGVGRRMRPMDFQVFYKEE